MPSKGEDYSDLIAAAGTEEGGPESFLHPDKFKPSRGQRKFANQTGPDAAGQLQQEKQKYPVQSLDETAAGATLSALDRASMGALGGSLRYGSENTPEVPESLRPYEQLLGLKDRRARSQQVLGAMEDYRKANPTESQLTDLPAYFTKGYTTLGEGAAKLAERPARFAAAGNPLGDLLRVGVPAAAVSAVPAATQEISEGGGAEDAAKAALSGAKSGVQLATTLAGGARLVGAAGRTVANSKGGKARRFIEERGGGAEVGLATPGEGGKFDDMITHGHDDAAIGAQAEESAKRGLGMLNEEHKGVRAALGIRKGNVAKTPEAAQLHDVSDVVAKIEDTLTDLDLSDYAEAKLEKALAKIKKAQGQGFNPETDSYLLSETDLNKLRTRLDKAAKTGESTDGSLIPLKEAANQVRELVSKGPYGDVNSQFAEEYSRNRKNRDLLGIQPKSKTPQEPNAAFNKVSNMLKRRGKNEITGGGESGRVAEFAERNPAIEEEFVKPELLRKRADIGFHVFPQHGGLYERLGPGAHYAAHALTHLGTGVIPPLLFTNRNAIAARLLYGPAMAAQAAEPLLLNEIPLLAAARNSLGDQ